jgi:hypothetical protein
VSDITPHIESHLAMRFSGVLAIVGVETRHLTHNAEVLRGQFPESNHAAIEAMKRITYCALRWKLWKRAEFVFKKLPRIIEDDEPLRFIIPFMFCEPMGRWYRLAPFVIDLENTGQAQGLVNVYAETQPVRIVDDQNRHTGFYKTIAQVILDRTTIVPARFNIRWSPWRATQ